ncbi:hypothetical protein LCGC14_2122760 [marine sediment metagenome]|uniref:Uncharacterized protein n=1 Tax=marine sediment metagenome TaxID=412755 RepID=A0A0F9E3S1_9ZZZZ
MKKPKRKKPKFYKGQVVKTRCGTPVSEPYWIFLQITTMRFNPEFGGWNYGSDREQLSWHPFMESELRPLTAKEIGPCRYCQERGQ